MGFRGLGFGVSGLGLLHLPGILCAQDHHLTPTKRQGHGSGRRHASRVPVAWKAAYRRPTRHVSL